MTSSRAYDVISGHWSKKQILGNKVIELRYDYKGEACCTVQYDGKENIDVHTLTLALNSWQQFKEIVNNPESMRIQVAAGHEMDPEVSRRIRETS